jgi:hypothetical protein
MLTTIWCILIKEEILQYKTIKIMIKGSKNNNNFTPVATYENPVIQKKAIYSENNGKSGIYR